eukprot:TRINITY_DN8701_c0_g1_i4.p1 TRINITY_DN8701_c0_g1~~TRINITY_DN8701_c0_g1_i4.p1  ORF type:complete len:105 (+),score=14.65 TRINITY_DN8701_c0_g1_i4:76-390(+)
MVKSFRERMQLIQSALSSTCYQAMIPKLKENGFKRVVPNEDMANFGNHLHPASGCALGRVFVGIVYDILIAISVLMEHATSHDRSCTTEGKLFGSSAETGRIVV